MRNNTEEQQQSLKFWRWTHLQPAQTSTHVVVFAVCHSIVSHNSSSRVRTVMGAGRGYKRVHLHPLEFINGDVICCLQAKLPRSH